MPFDRRAYDLARYRRTRAECLALLGGACVDCGGEFDLQFDHVDRVEKLHGIDKLCCGYPRDVLLRELAKCVLRCKPCHLKKSSLKGDDHSVSHGGGLSGKKGCACQPCKDRKNEYMRAWKRNRKAQGIKVQ